jgi:uncharacterized integral membrane protein
MVRILKLLILVPLVILVLAFAVANRAMTIVSFDPFSAAAQASPTIQAPLFLVLLLTLAVGVVLGSAATWLAQSAHRRTARHARHESERLRGENERLRTDQAARGPMLPSA